MITSEYSFETHETEMDMSFNFFEREDKTYATYSCTYEIKDEKDSWIDYDNIVLEESKELLIRLSKILELGEVSLEYDEDDFYPPTFYIQAPSSLNPEERIMLSDKIFNRLYNYYELREQLENMNKFFFKLDFEE